MHVVRLADLPTMPWKNGGGVTRDVLAWPDAAQWQCRISVADVERSGPFSAYPGVDRWFAVLQGAGVVLHLPSGARRLVPGSAPLNFDGADAPGCDLVDGATLDLNLMVQRAAGRGAMMQAGAAAWVDEAPLRAVFCVSAAVLLVDGEPPWPLPAMSLAWSDRAAGLAWRVVSGSAMADAHPSPSTALDPFTSPRFLDVGTAVLAPSPAERERAGGEGATTTASTRLRSLSLHHPSPPALSPLRRAREPVPPRAAAELAVPADKPARDLPALPLPTASEDPHADVPRAWWLSFHPHTT